MIKRSNKLVNPYRPFDPTVETFVGRQKILDFFHKRITIGSSEYESSRHILLLGGAGTGKTSTIAKFLASCRNKELVKVSLDVGKCVEDIEGFLVDLFAQIEYIPRTKFSLKKLAKSISLGFPSGVQLTPGEIFTAPLPLSIDSRLSEAIAFIISTTQHKGKRYLLTIDQYGKLSEMQGGCHVVRHLASLVQTSHERKLSDILVVLALRPERKGVLEFPFGNNIFDETLFEKFGLYPFTKREMTIAISKPLEVLPLKFGKSTIQAIQQEVKNNIPFQVSVACHLVWERAVSSHRPVQGTMNISTTQVRRLLKGGQEYIYDRFTPSQQEVLKILAQSHPIPLSIQTVAKKLTDSPRRDLVDDVGRVMKHLKDHELRPLQYIERRNGYMISHDLFADYILTRHCQEGSREIVSLQGILDYAPSLVTDGEFSFNEFLLNRMWSFRKKLHFSPPSYKAIAGSILSLPEESWEVHFQWFSTLGRQFRDALLHFRLSELDEVRKKGLARAMGVTKNTDFVGCLVKLLVDVDNTVRVAAAESLGALKHKDAINSLVSGLKDSEADVREACVEALGKINLKYTIPELSAALRDESYQVVQAAGEAIAHIGGTEAFEVLKKASKSRKNELRRIAIQVLPDIEHPDVKHLLISKLRSKQPEARVWVTEALSRLDDPEVIPALARRLFDQCPTVALASARALSRKSNETSWRALGRALLSPIPGLRYFAESSLMAAPATLRLELARIRTSDPWFTKTLKTSILGDIVNEDAFDILKVLLSDPDERVRSSAIRSLAPYKKQRILDKLDDALGDSSALVRKSALEVVLRMDKPVLNQRIEALQNDSDPTISWLAHRLFGKSSSRQYSVENETADRNIKGLPNSFEKRLDKIRTEEIKLTEQVLSYPARRGLSKGPEAALTSKNPKIVVRAAKLIDQTGAIGRGNARDSYDKLIGTLLCSENPEIRTAIVEYILSSEAYDSLYSSISSDKNFKVRLAAVNKIGLKYPRGVEAILKGLSDPCWLVRSRAIFRLSGKKNVLILEKAIKIMRRYNNKELPALFWGLELLYKERSTDLWQIPLVKQEDNPALWWDLFEDFRREMHERWERYEQKSAKFTQKTSAKKTNKPK